MNKIWYFQDRQDVDNDRNSAPIKVNGLLQIKKKKKSNQNWYLLKKLKL